MNTHALALKTYEDLQKRKKSKEERKHLLECEADNYIFAQKLKNYKRKAKIRKRKYGGI